MTTTCKDCVVDFNTPPPEGLAKNRNLGLVVAGVIGGGALLLSAICVPFVTPALRKICLPYVPATTSQVENVIKALKGRKGTLVDLGSGDGRIVLEAAKVGFKSTGVELNPWLVMYSKFQAFRSGISSMASFHRRDIWKTDLSKFDNVVIFGVDSMMKDLEVKCSQEMHDKSVIAACRFSFPNRIPHSQVGEGIDAVWLYDNSLSAPLSTNSDTLISNGSASQKIISNRKV
ncbi:ATP synthase subunit C lysine N-methyltransferase isoform X2 [Folsomia candida]|uniref:Methyltransferase domain-containing protein n=1 Tax=Folsomia candida TaxID=158441 RepID=A0A226DG01_FOLCA|nr:ATP synthase subunit C lysine N-methyltransferase isoform X2 [Folsomia candida]XP_021962545.1 ATP synthase subunit C lysine N-methyltransferase isoform X2 [Folsomia candida]OXA44060.1 hypothetical protein Fcan01_21210 [Folsomia candida]